MTLTAKEGNKILLLWGSGTPPEKIKQVVDSLSENVGKSGSVQVENLDRLLMSGHGPSTFDIAMCGHVTPAAVLHSGDVLAELARILKPDGVLSVREVTVATETGSSVRTVDKLQSALKLAGLVQVSQAEPVSVSEEELAAVKSTLGGAAELSYVEVTARKPAYEVGASVQLKLPWVKKTNEPQVDSNTAAVWSLASNDILDDDIDIMDSDELLDEEDLKKPDPASLRVQCGTGEKRKACKNCTCGLADELDAEAAAAQGGDKQKSAPTSSCGSCYLGDAFRCASCPYLGMPAFKPGEKISLSSRQLNADK